MKLPRCNLRDLFWLTALMAMGCAWWTHERQRTRVIEDRQTLIKYWAISEVSPEFMLQPGERLEAVATDHANFTIRVHDTAGLTIETEFTVEGPTCGASAKKSTIKNP